MRIVRQGIGFNQIEEIMREEFGITL